MIKLFEFQEKASTQIVERFAEFLENPPMRGRKEKRLIPFYQALAAITGAGKTAILAETISRMHALLPIKPIVLWLSKGRVVVFQSYANLQDGGKYRHLLREYEVRLLTDFDATEVEDPTRSFMFFAPVGTFNQKDMELGDRKIYRSDIDTAEQSTWDALRTRQVKNGPSRPLIIVYDEAQNLSDQQMQLLMRLEPHAILVASATMRLPEELEKVLQSLREDGWTDDELTTYIDPSQVVDAGLIKSDVVMGGYAAPMEKAISDMLLDMKRATKAARALGHSVRPKAIYVSKTNIKETNILQKDDPKRPFRNREAPPIRIWRYLVEEQGVDPGSIAVYANLEFDMKRYPPPIDFVLYKGGERDYDLFVSSRYDHIIFNLTLQEGWDDPECYFAYIDKSMGSPVQVEQIIGRVLRQPQATRFEHESLNTARFYVRVDAKGVFQELVDKVSNTLDRDGVKVKFTSYVAGNKGQPRLVRPRKLLQVPRVALNAADALEPVQRIVDELPEFSEESANTKGKGARALVRQRIGTGAQADWKWVPYEHGNRVSARWIFQVEVAKQYPRALDVAGSDDPKFDVKVELGSRADKIIREKATQVVDAYLDYVRIEQRVPNPYQVQEMLVDPSKEDRFKHAGHSSYSGLNPLERDFAKALDRTKLPWVRNPSQSGFSIPLFTKGQTRNFYPDFLVWKGKTIYALDTTGQHLLGEKTATKLLTIKKKRGLPEFRVALVSEDQWNEKVRRVGKGGYTVWALGPAQDLRHHHYETVDEALVAALKL